LLKSLPVGVGQIYGCDNPWTGGIFLCAMLLSSPLMCLHAAIGSLLGVVAGLSLAAPFEDIYAGLWGFNSSLACIAIGGMFMALTWQTHLLALACGPTASLYLGLLFGHTTVSLDDYEKPQYLQDAPQQICVGSSRTRHHTSYQVQKSHHGDAMWCLREWNPKYHRDLPFYPMTKRSTWGTFGQPQSPVARVHISQVIMAIYHVTQAQVLRIHSQKARKLTADGVVYIKDCVQYNSKYSL
ncbi:hypothetical protein A6R68_17603, partial [Neotoma lepida]